MSGRQPEGKKHITAFYMETLALIAVFVVVILVLARVFALAGQQSRQARLLTRAVRLAENAAEAVAASDSWESLAALLKENGDVCELTGNVWETTSGVAAAYRLSYNRDMEPDKDGEFRVDVTWNPQQAGDGTFVESTVCVYWDGAAEPIYTLETAVYLPVSAVNEDTGGRL